MSSQKPHSQAANDLTHVDTAGRVQMVDVGDKPATVRRAVAEGRVRVLPQLAQKIQANNLVKGNLLEMARVAGIQAAKRTSELIPLAHNIPLDHVHVDAWLEDHWVRLRAEVSTTAKTGVEMEALVAVSAAALTVIDMGKAVDPAMVIEELRLLEKTGGTHGDFHRPQPEAKAAAGTTPKITVAVLTVSDRGWRGETEDTSGPALAEMVRQSLGAEVVATACVPDDAAMITAQLRAWALAGPKPDLILTTGGTGLAPRDVTPEATLAALERRHPGLLDLARLRCSAQTPRAYLSRGEAGTIQRSLVINLPGSRRGATEYLAVLLDVLPHALETLRGEVQDDGRPDARPTTGKVIEHQG